MNGTSEQPEMVHIACANCAWFQNIRPDALGECWRYPPQVIVLFGQKADFASANVQAVQRPTNVRATMMPDSFCGEFRPSPAGWVRRTVEPQQAN